MPIGKPDKPSRLHDRSHALRGNESMDALRPLWDAERPGLHSHAERGNDQSSAISQPTIPRTMKYNNEGPSRHPSPVWNVAVNAP
ncbi:hypothetical protein SAMN04489798_1403 [Pseudomonas arsenicoxydans]|uniref:Uncharacterized protein n=1 Tax=Pseudomonas arsenicoxydans TaxID=702115 RepID=A0A1H0EZ50_9PSED|nr:hypothetical protein SAMN04489798_1403 [Pseudomonas arsenicoxydans]